MRERGARGWCEVEVWEDGGQSSASVTREEWGPESRRARAEKGAPRKLKRLVCGGPVIRAALMQRAATTSEGWEIAASPSRWQYAPTTRVRAAVPLVKLVKHLASLPYISR